MGLKTNQYMAHSPKPTMAIWQPKRKSRSFASLILASTTVSTCSVQAFGSLMNLRMTFAFACSLWPCGDEGRGLCQRQRGCRGVEAAEAAARLFRGKGLGQSLRFLGFRAPVQEDSGHVDITLWHEWHTSVRTLPTHSPPPAVANLLHRQMEGVDTAPIEVGVVSALEHLHYSPTLLGLHGHHKLQCTG